MWRIVPLTLLLAGCANVYPTRVYYEIHEAPQPQMHIVYRNGVAFIEEVKGDATDHQ